MAEQSTPKNRQEIEAHIIAQAWKDDEYKQKLLSNPKAVIEREFSVQLPTEVNVQILEENATKLYFVLPMSPGIPEDELSEQELETVAGGLLPFTITKPGGTLPYSPYCAPIVQTLTPKA